MKNLFLVSLLIACEAFAGNGSRQRMFVPGGGGSAATSTTASQATTADLTLYVDPLGSDSNACTASGASACLTLPGVVAKMPKIWRHIVTTNVAAGNYGGVLISGFTIDPAYQRTAGLIINGVMGNVTPATGSATGTATSGSAGSVTTFGTLGDSGATWTTNDFRGKFIKITGGTGSGQVKPITGNTGTVITIAGTWTAPVGASSTYAIQTPTSIINVAAAQVSDVEGGIIMQAAGIQVMNNNLSTSSSTLAPIIIRNMGVSASCARVIGSPVLFSQDLLSSGTCSMTNGANAFVTDSVVTTTSTFIASRASLYLRSSYLVPVVSASSGGFLNAILCQFNNSSTIPTIQVTTNATASVTQVRCDCNSAATSACVGTGTSTTVATQPGGSVNVATGLDVTNCSRGVSAVGPGSIVAFVAATAFTGNATAYAIDAINGGQVFMPSTPAITATTAELSIDNGTATGTFASLTAIYSCLTSSATGSRICRL